VTPTGGDGGLGGQDGDEAGDASDASWPPPPGALDEPDISAALPPAGTPPSRSRRRRAAAGEGDGSFGDEFWAGSLSGAGAGDDVPDRRARGEARRDEQRRRRRRRRVVLGVLALLVLPFLLFGGWFVWQLYEPGGDGAPVSVSVQQGWGAKEIGDELASKDVVGSSLVFQVWYRVAGGSSQAGTYTLHEHMGVKAAVDALSDPPATAAASAEHTVLALPPGLRLEQIADRVGALPGHDRAAFLALAQSGEIRSRYQGDQASVEGFTWPDTYFVEGMDDRTILQTIVSEFDKHGDTVGLGTAASAGAATGLTPQQTVVVASLVQAEAGTAADAPKVAAVITNRLKQGTPLQIDATLCYAKGGCPPVPTNADKQIDSPYNTYKVNGLPPTPIMTVTEQSLKAALAPANVPYLFYVTGKDGVTYYATTLAEHDANIRAHGVSGE
jgi:peptidoglycan lytic transglycosylase G